MIILDEAQAAQVRGETAQGHALDPVALANGTQWVLSEAVLSDPAHAVHHQFLSGLPTRAVGPEEYQQSNPLE